jgi:hypothetical protein
MADPDPRILITPSLLNLPVELRLQIYSHLFANSEIRLPRSPQHHRHNDGDFIREQPHQVLFVCRQTYLEANRLFYGAVTWNFVHHAALAWFLGPCEQRRPRMHWVKRIRLSCVQMLALLPFAELTALSMVEILVDGDAYLNYADGGMFDIHLTAGELLALARDTVEETLATLASVRHVYESLRGRERMRVRFIVDHTFCGKAGLRRTVRWTDPPLLFHLLTRDLC